MGVCAVQNQHGLYAILIYQARQLEKEQRKHIKPHKQLWYMVNLHHLILKERIVVHLKTHIHPWHWILHAHVHVRLRVPWTIVRNVYQREYFLHVVDLTHIIFRVLDVISRFFNTLFFVIFVYQWLFIAERSPTQSYDQFLAEGEGLLVSLLIARGSPLHRLWRYGTLTRTGHVCSNCSHLCCHGGGTAAHG